MPTKMTEEHTFDPNSMEVDDAFEEELGEFDSYVDKLEAESAADDAVVESGDADAEDAGADTEEVDEEQEEVDEPEEEDEDEEESESEEDVAPEDELANADENPVVPRERLNQESRKRQEEADRANNLERELAQMRAQMESAAETAGVENINPSILKDAAEKALDGDTDAFANMLAEQFNTQNERLTRNQEKIREAAKQEALNEFRQEQAIKERQEAAAVWEGVYPSLDPNHENLNQEALDEAISLVGMFEQRGYSPAAAMERAVKSVAVNYDLQSTNDSTVVPQNTIAAKKAVAKTKKVTKKPVNQPPSTGEASGLDKTETKYNTETMSQDEWDALPDSVRDEILTGGM